MSSLIFDIETDGLENYTTIHSLVIQDNESGKIYSCTDHDPEKYSIADGLALLAKADRIIGHNIICFDLPVIYSLHPSFSPKGQVRDTLNLSRLVYPDLIDRDYSKYRRMQAQGKAYPLPAKLYGRHSLEAWGYRLSQRKDDFGKTTDWKEWSPEMQMYCEQDVAVTACLWEHFLQKDYSQQAVELEHQFQKIIYQQELNGFPFDVKKAETLYVALCEKRETLRVELQELWPPVDKGSWWTPKRDNKTKGYKAGVPVWKPDVVEFNPGSRDDIVERLKETYGWQPTEFTTTGKAKIDDEVLETLPYPEAKKLSEYFLLQKRCGQIGEGKQAWLKVVADDGCIHGRVTTNGAVTGRCTHHDPNLAQVPAVGVPYGKECRELFYAPKGWSLLGCDASGLELRCLAHYMARYDGGNYADVILHGDIHWANAQSLGLVSQGIARDHDNPDHEYARNKIAKRFIYAFLYGAGPYKIGTVCGLSDTEKERYLSDKRKNSLARRLQERGVPFDDDVLAYTLKGGDLKNRFLKQLPALNSLITDVQLKVKDTGVLRGLDGRILPVRSQHSALNTLLQSAGALAVKKATCLFWDSLVVNKLDTAVSQVAHVHDEFQLLVKEGCEEQVGVLAVQAFRNAGTYFKFRCPLDGEYKAGKNWAETH